MEYFSIYLILLWFYLSVFQFSSWRIVPILLDIYLIISLMGCKYKLYWVFHFKSHLFIAGTGIKKSFIALHVIVLCRYCFFLQIEGLWKTCIEQVYWCHFFQQHLLTSCLLHFGNYHNISNFFIIIIFVMVICDRWSYNYYCNCFGATNWGCIEWQTQLINMCVLTAPLTDC